MKDYGKIIADNIAKANRRDNRRYAQRQRWQARQRQHPHLQVCPYCGSVNEIVNQCGCDPNNLPTKI